MSAESQLSSLLPTFVQFVRKSPAHLQLRDADERRAFLEAELSAATAPCITSSFQAGSVILLHMLRDLRPDIPVLFLDTVHHFHETYAYRDQLAKRWKLNVITLKA